MSQRNLSKFLLKSNDFHTQRIRVLHLYNRSYLNNEHISIYYLDLYNRYRYLYDICIIYMYYLFELDPNEQCHKLSTVQLRSRTLIF